HPVAYYSKALGVASQKTSIYEKEFLAIMMAVDRWRSYLSGAPFVIKTDHQSLCHLGDQNLTSDLQRKAMTKLVGLQFSIQYKKEVKNTAADALSRVAHLFVPQAVSTSKPVWIQEILNSYTVDPNAQLMLQKLAVDSKACPGFQLQEGLIKQEGKIWVGANTGLQTKLIQAFHSSPIGGHSGILPTYHKVK
uniref:Reverse transcriptase RNase H-like domain-containing protein n=1 Tax=Aegilops tauschii subsp. strangulata TaxID=200361 RepID=A0A453D8R9_AEGTS